MNKEIFGCVLLSVRVTMVLIQLGVKRRWIFWDCTRQCSWCNGKIGLYDLVDIKKKRVTHLRLTGSQWYKTASLG